MYVRVKELVQATNDDLMHNGDRDAEGGSVEGGSSGVEVPSSSLSATRYRLHSAVPLSARLNPLHKLCGTANHVPTKEQHLDHAGCDCKATHGGLMEKYYYDRVSFILRPVR